LCSARNVVELQQGSQVGSRVAGVTVMSVRYNGTIHESMLLNPIANTPAVRGAIDQASGYLRKVFADR